MGVIGKGAPTGRGVSVSGGGYGGGATVTSIGSWGPNGMSTGTSSGGTVGGMPAPPPPPPAPTPMNITADEDPRLTGLLDQANTYLTDLRKGTGEVEETTAQKLRDAREGGRTAMRQSNTARGVASSNAVAGYDAETQRGENAAIAGVAEDRRNAIGTGIANAATIAGGIGARALAEKQFSLQSWQAENAALQSQYAQYLALLNASRNSPINNVEASPPIVNPAGGGGGYAVPSPLSSPSKVIHA